MSKTVSKKRTESARVLLQDLQEHLKNNGLERRRTGGSSGQIAYSDELLLLLQSHNSSPRCSKGTVFLRDKDNLKWHLFYLGTKNGGVKYTYYTNPVPGGSFKMHPKLLQKYECLRDFASVRPMGALVLEKIEQHIQQNRTNVPVKNVCPIAMKQELTYIDNARHFLKDIMSHHEKKQGKKLTYEELILLFYEFYAENFQNYTLVMHAVGGHLDVFADGKPSLETRICFSFLLDKFENTSVWNSGSGNGRGGAGMDKFCFALIHWEAPSHNRRNTWTDPRNTHLPHSAAHYGRENGHGRQTLNRTIWDHFRRNGNLIALQDNVNHVRELNYPPRIRRGLRNRRLQQRRQGGQRRTRCNNNRR